MVDTSLAGSPYGDLSKDPSRPGVEQYSQQQKAQQAVLMQHKQFAQALQQKQADVQMRQGDLTIAQRLMRALDPSIPKPARQFLMVELAKYLGIDPKSENFKGVSGMIQALDPDSLQLLRTMFSRQVEGSQPGQVIDMARGIMSGQVPMDDIIGELQGMDIQGGAGQDTMAGGSGDDKVAQPGPSGSGPGAVRSFEGQRTIPDGAKQASPQLVKALGLDSRQPFRNDDLMQQGYSIPFDAKDQEKLAQEINVQSTNVSSTIRESGRLLGLFRNRPEVLGPVGDFVRRFQSTVRQVQGALTVLNPAFQDQSNPYDKQVKGAAQEAGKNLARLYGYSKRTAEDAARVEAAVLGLAYRMAGAQNIPGNRLTNGIIEQQLRQIGASSSPEQFEAVLKDTLDGTLRTFDEGVRRQLGVSGNKILAQQLTDQDIVEFAQAGGSLPQEFATALRDEAVARRDGTKQTGPQPASPTIQEEQQTLGSLETERKQRELDKFDQERQLAADRDKRAASAEQRAESREERMTAAQERSQTLAEDRFTYDKEMTNRRDARAEEAADRAESREERMVKQNEASMGLQREKFEYDKANDQRNLEQRQAEKLAEAFRAFGQAIANSVPSISGGGGGSGGGGQQDVGAFRLTPMPQRQPPAIPRGGN